MTNEEEYYHKIAGKISESVKGQLFGKPCYKINGKAFCCFFQNEMVFKLSKGTHQTAMSLDGSKLFDPSGKKRPMKEWVQIPFDYQENWKKFTQSAAKYCIENQK